MGLCISREDRQLMGLTYETTPRFVPEFRKAKVVSVYDGDTVTLAAFHLKKPYLFRCRLARIDAPEMTHQTGKTKAAREKERKKAEKARDALKRLILNRIVHVDIQKLEKYGRVLAELRIGRTNVSDWMVKHRHAVPYDGGAKKVWF